MPVPETATTPVSSDAITNVANGAVSGGHDLSIIGLFMHADFVVQFVMLVLISMSVWCWTIIISKRLTLKKLNRRAEKFEEAFWSGSSATFIGLFGTVWGIMNSFTAIAAMNNTSLAVVAPGIAEALFATATGLVAAIPAMVSYNVFSTSLGRYGDRLHNFATEFSAIMSRHLDGQEAAERTSASTKKVGT